MANGRKKGNNAAQYEAEMTSTASSPFEAGEHGQIAVKVIDDRGNELIVVKSLPEAGKS